MSRGRGQAKAVPEAELALGVLMVERFPLELRRKVRARAARTGRTLREVIIEAAEEWLKRNGGAK